MREILSGNEAIARGAWEAGARFAGAYPGTPSTEILENIVEYPDIYSEWCPNEKVALETALGAALAGARALCAMKHVGVNVAADPLMTASYVGVKGGLVLVSADDPALHSSQNEQDNRNYAKFAKIPLLEPSDSQECKDFTRLAFEISEEFDTPVMLRTTTRISHSKSIVELSERAQQEPLTTLEKNAPKYTMLPNFAKGRHVAVEQRLLALSRRSDSIDINRIEMGDPRVGIVASGAAYVYAREAFPDASFLKLGMSYPLPKTLLLKFRAQVDKLYVVEELDPFFEDQIKAMDIAVDGGKSLLSLLGELDPGIVASSLASENVYGANPDLTVTPLPMRTDLPTRPPTMCPGCSHRGVFTVLSRMKVFVSGDIGCYTLGALPPLASMHSCVCMGAGIGMAHGMAKVLEPGGRTRNRPVAVIGDSTFFHSGMTPLLNSVWNQSDTVTIILDNRTTAMTGGQQNPGSGKTLSGKFSPAVDLVKLCEAFGVKHIRTVDSYDLASVETTIKDALLDPGASVIITQGPCVLEYKIKHDPWVVDTELCTGCKRCLRVACIALGLAVTPDGKTIVEIDPTQCNGCGVCAQMCRFDAIKAPAPVSA
ncbi:MAG: indolepyruvate ferredoxin oxidoreductase subunit alpha [Actinobacteria bacterium]|nr:indolepyruvate ferredoxin oxidoreductase subunit alpha [Actinomycetota bacterium]